MTLDEAVKVLNGRRHDGYDRWRANEDGFVEGHDPYHVLSPFEAVAVAEKYQRAVGTKPGTVHVRIAVAVAGAGLDVPPPAPPPTRNPGTRF
jgi:hypothetical protein